MIPMCNFEFIILKLPYLTATASASFSASALLTSLFGLFLHSLLGMLLGMLLVFSSYTDTLSIRALGAFAPGPS